MVTHANNFHDPSITTTHILKVRKEIEILQTQNRQHNTFNFSTNRSNSWQLRLFFDIFNPVSKEITTDSIDMLATEIAYGIAITPSNLFSSQEGATCGMPTISTREPFVKCFIKNALLQAE